MIPGNRNRWASFIEFAKQSFVPHVVHRLSSNSTLYMRCGTSPGGIISLNSLRTTPVTHDMAYNETFKYPNIQVSTCLQKDIHRRL